MNFTYDRTENVIFACYSEFGVRTEDVAVILETFLFKQGFFSILKKGNLCFHAHFESRFSSFNLLHIDTIFQKKLAQPENSICLLIHVTFKRNELEGPGWSRSVKF